MAVFRIPCNWDPALIDALEGIDVADIFGMLPSHVAGGGRPSAAVPKVEKDAAVQFIRAARDKGFSFNYLFNAPCMDALEFTDAWRREFLEHLDWAVDAGADAVTVAVPYLIEIIHKRHPDLHISVSSYARVNSIRRAQYFRELGAGEIILDPISTTRNFALLEAMAQNVACRLTLIANGMCLSQCPFAEYHGVLMGHSSQAGHPSGGFYEEYPFYNCTLRKLSNPAELLRTMFIRPEDLHVYEDLGIRSFKLVDRSRPTAWIAAAAGAYSSRRWDGDLLQIINFPHFFLGFLYQKAGGEGRPVFPTIDNRKLDGFIDRLRQAGGDTPESARCEICEEFAGAVDVPKGVDALAGILKGTLSRLDFA